MVEPVLKRTLSMAELGDEDMIVDARRRKKIGSVVEARVVVDDGKEEEEEEEDGMELDQGSEGGMSEGVEDGQGVGDDVMDIDERSEEEMSEDGELRGEEMAGGDDEGLGLSREEEEDDDDPEENEDKPEENADDPEETNQSLLQKKHSAIDFFEKLYHARYGLLTSIRLPTKPDPRYKDSLYESWRDHTVEGEIEQTEEQQQLESFFQHDLGTWDANERLKFVKAHLNPDQKQAAKKWSDLSLPMRLNLIQSLQEIERKKSVEEKAVWKILRGDALTTRTKCEKAQSHLIQPSTWDTNTKSKVTHRKPHRPLPRETLADKLRNDKLLALADINSSPTAQNQHPIPDPSTKSTIKFDHITFTSPQTHLFNTLLSQSPVPDLDPNRTRIKPPWRPEEFHFCYRWMLAKGDSVDWRNDKAQGRVDLEMAHKTFFTNFLFEGAKGGKTVSLRRGGAAIVRKLKEKGGVKFRKWFGVAAEGDGEDGVDEGHAGKSQQDGDMKMEVDVEKDDKVVASEAAESNEEDDDDISEELVGTKAEVVTRLKVKLNMAGFRSEGAKNAEEVKKDFEQRTGQKVPDRSGDTYDEDLEEVDR